MVKLPIKFKLICKVFFSLVLGGIPFGKVTEVCGVAGAGKTQFWFVFECF